MGLNCFVIRFFCFLVLLCPCSHSQPPAGPVHRRFEYKHSFRAPNLAQSDGTVPFWLISGDAIASSEQIRLAPSMRSKKGACWNKKPMTESEHWMVEMAIKVTGQGRAFWYTASPGQLGQVFGSNDYWTGLGIFFDSFDNDAQRNNPYIMMMINDGTRGYEHQTDGAQQALTGCQKDYRNRPHPVKMKVEYLKNVIQVFIHDGMTQHDRWELCMRAENIYLPRNGYFGVSAATGGIADDHDVLSFSTTSFLLEPPKPPSTIEQSETDKFQKEFEQQQKQFEEEKEKFKREHPDQVKEEEDPTKYYQDSQTRELQMIFEGQNTIYQLIQTLEGKLNNIVNTQNSHTQYLAQGRAEAPAQPGQAPAQVQPAGVGFNRNEVNEALQLLREATAALRDMKPYVNDIYARAMNIENKIPAGVGSVTGGTDLNVQNMVNSIKQDTEQIRMNQRTPQGGMAACPNVACLSPTLFFIVIAAQTAIGILFVVLRKGSEKSKFY